MFNLYYPVIYKNQAGSLILRDNAVCFYEGDKPGPKILEIGWLSVTKISCNDSSSPSALLKLTLSINASDNNNTATFKFDSRKDLEKAKYNMKTRWYACHEETGMRNDDNDDDDDDLTESTSDKKRTTKKRQSSTTASTNSTKSTKSTTDKIAKNNDNQKQQSSPPGPQRQRASTSSTKSLPGIGSRTSLKTPMMSLRRGQSETDLLLNKNNNYSKKSFVNPTKLCYPVTYKKSAGSLIAGDDTICFFDGDKLGQNLGQKVLEIEWLSVTRIRGNVSSSPSALLKLTLNNNELDDNTVTFKFNSRKELNQAKYDMKTLWYAFQDERNDNNDSDSDFAETTSDKKMTRKNESITTASIKSSTNKSTMIDNKQQQQSLPPRPNRQHARASTNSLPGIDSATSLKNARDVLRRGQSETALLPNNGKKNSGKYFNITKLYYPVTCKNRVGALVVQDDNVCFYDGDDPGQKILEIKWMSVAKMTANVPSSPSALLKLTLSNSMSDDNTLTFKFKTREELNQAKHDMKFRWNASLNKTDIRDDDDDETTSDKKTMKKGQSITTVSTRSTTNKIADNDKQQQQQQQQQQSSSSSSSSPPRPNRPRASASTKSLPGIDSRTSLKALLRRGQSETALLPNKNKKNRSKNTSNINKNTKNISNSPPPPPVLFSKQSQIQVLPQDQILLPRCGGHYYRLNFNDFIQTQRIEIAIVHNTSENAVPQRRRMVHLEDLLQSQGFDDIEAQQQQKNDPSERVPMLGRLATDP